MINIIINIAFLTGVVKAQKAVKVDYTKKGIEQYKGLTFALSFAT